jgi:hypothetical protein
LEKQSNGKNRKDNSSAQNSQSKQGTDYQRSNGKNNASQCKDETDSNNSNNYRN